MNKLLTAAAVLAAAAIGASAPALAQTYPSKTITIVVPTAAGGGNDAMARTIAQKLGPLLGQTVIIDNRAGANGSIASEFVARAPADGHTLMLGYIATHAMNPALQKLRYDPVADFEPIGLVGYSPTLMVANANVPVKDVKDLVAQLKANPGSVSWSGGSRGSIDHILAALIAKESGVDPTKINYIPSAGGGESAAAIIGGQVTAGLAGYSEFAQHIKSGKMRALAVSSSAKLPGEATATLKEQGFNIEIYNWRGVYGAPGITEAQQKALIDAVVAAANTPAWKAALEKNDWTPLLLTGADFGKFVDAESARLGALLKEVGIAK